jgi:anaerobic magnesium-protoporphyrin IX monomethyl ester cyclase
MRILLVEPPKVNWELMGNCISPPLGLAYLAAVLEKEEIEVKIVDCNASKLSWLDLESEIKKTHPDVIGVTAITPFFYETLHVAKLAKGIDEGVTTVVGGPHVTFMVEETFYHHSEIDVIVRGEGEQTFLDLIKCLEKDGNLSEVDGIAFRRNDEIVQTNPQTPINVNDLPFPAYHLLPMEKYYFTILGKFATILSSRGCPYKCTFCSEWRFWRHYRTREPKSIVDEMELLHKRYGRDSIWFGDDCFNVNHNHIQGICDEIIERDLNISWFYQGRADFLIRYKDLLPEMRKAGNLMVQIGVETSKNEEMRLFRKGLTIDQVKLAVDLLKKHDIVSQGLIIIGTRNDDANSIIHKVRYMKWLDVDFPIFTIYTPFPGSDVYEEAKRNNWLEIFDYAKYDMANIIMPTEYLSRRQLASLYHWSFSNCYLDLIKLAKGLFSRNEWKRHIWRHMMKYTMKQIAHSLR